MSDKERFEIFKENMLQKNEDKYGQEVRTKYGDTSMEQANEKIRDMTAADYQRFQKLGDEILLCLKEAVTQGISPKSEEGKRIVLLHKEWLGMTWKTYSKQAHEGLAQIYVLDQRFMTYYDREVPGCAKFLRNAVGFWLDNM
ncbi:TipAS antibiotic-recognition domain-containing protein [Anaerotignum sp.]|uniref:TipAS antibiotic-recognition domain-containing protein n=1 Tax=Anaerotignum sp. TaxID=2039241 RepID=UPI003332EFF0